MVGARHHGLKAGPLDGLRDVAVIRGHIDALRAAFARALCDPHDHRLASDVGERLARKAAGRETRRDDGGESAFHSLTSSSGGSFLASSSSMTGMSSRM